MTRFCTFFAEDAHGNLQRQRLALPNINSSVCQRMGVRQDFQFNRGKPLSFPLAHRSTDRCRSIFLDENTIIALERNEQEAVLRMAGIENLESCPFCPYAAEYPPVEVDREFRCQAPECEKVSCRLCKLESHIPKSCE